MMRLLLTTNCPLCKLSNPFRMHREWQPFKSIRPMKAPSLMCTTGWALRLKQFLNNNNNNNNRVSGIWDECHASANKYTIRDLFIWTRLAKISLSYHLLWKVNRASPFLRKNIGILQRNGIGQPDLGQPGSYEQVLRLGQLFQRPDCLVQKKPMTGRNWKKDRKALDRRYGNQGCGNIRYPVSSIEHITYISFVESDPSHRNSVDPNPTQAAEILGPQFRPELQKFCGPQIRPELQKFCGPQIRPQVLAVTNREEGTRSTQFVFREKGGGGGGGGA